MSLKLVNVIFAYSEVAYISPLICIKMSFKMCMAIVSASILPKSSEWKICEATSFLKKNVISERHRFYYSKRFMDGFFLMYKTSLNKILESIRLEEYINHQAQKNINE